MEWSNYQKTIFKEVETTDNNILVGAVAGSGKSSTIFHCLTLSNKRQLVLSFNQEIAKNGRKRAEKDMVLKQRLDKDLFISTFHSYGITIIKESGFWIRHGVKVNPNKVADFVFKNPIIDDSLKNYFYVLLTNLRGHGVLTTDPEELSTLFKRNWSSLLTATCDKNDAKMINRRMKLLANCLKELDKDVGQIDFDDMLRFPLIYGLFTKVNSLVIPNILYVDEVQDVNAAQLGFIKQIMDIGGRIIAFGDAHQAIYGFRGAMSNSIGMVKRLTQAKELPLSVSYRCASKIVSFCHADYQEKELTAPEIEAYTQGGRVIVCKSLDDDKYRVDLVLKHGIKMVVSAKNKHLVSICISLMNQNQACNLKKSKLTTVIKRIVRQFEQEKLPFSMLVKRVKELLGSPDVKDGQKDSLSATLEFITGFGLKTYTEVYERIKVMDKQKKGIHLHTVHSAKGLEEDSVMVIDDFFNSEDNQMQNMRYVAFTRAKELLMVCRVKKR